MKRILCLSLIIATVAQAGTDQIKYDTSNGHVKTSSSNVGTSGKPFDWQNVYQLIRTPTVNQAPATKLYVDDHATPPIGFSTDGSGAVITTGIKVYQVVHYSGTITGFSITADGSSPTCTIDVWKIGAGTALPTVTNTIFGTKPSLSTGNVREGSCPTNCSGWTTTFSDGDVFGFNVDALTVATKLTFKLKTKQP